MTPRWMVLLGVALLATPGRGEEPPGITTEQQKLSYSLGVDIARNFKRQGVEVDLEVLLRGIQDGLTGEKLAVPEKELRKIREDFFVEARRKQVLDTRNPGLANKDKGEAFLEANKARDGVITLPSGLQYKILQAGSGRIPTADDTVECHYRGTLLDGTEFDSTEDGKPATLKIKGGVIPGWAEALKLMPEGSKWRLFIPSGLAYGAQGVRRSIGPNETIIYDLELIAIK